MEVIKYNNKLLITNLSQLPHGVGAKYLEVLRDDSHGVLIAKQWRRVAPNYSCTLVKM